MSFKTVATELGRMEIHFLGGERARVNTAPNDCVQVRDKRYSFSASFARVEGRWRREAHCVRHLNLANSAASSVAAKVIDTARAALQAQAAA